MWWDASEYSGGAAMAPQARRIAETDEKRISSVFETKQKRQKGDISLEVGMKIVAQLKTASKTN